MHFGIRIRVSWTLIFSFFVHLTRLLYHLSCAHILVHMHVKNIIGKAILAKFESIVFSLSLAYLTNKWDSSELAFILLPSDLTGLCDPPPFPSSLSPDWLAIRWSVLGRCMPNYCKVALIGRAYQRCLKVVAVVQNMTKIPPFI